MCASHACPNLAQGAAISTCATGSHARLPAPPQAAPPAHTPASLPLTPAPFIPPQVHFNEEEVSEVQWIALPELKQRMEEEPGLFTEWFRAEVQLLGH